MDDTIEHEVYDFSISDLIEKLYELELISRNTLACLRSAIGQNGYNYDPNIVVTLADIIYVPKVELFRIPNMGNKSITEIVEFINNYPIQGRIMPTEEDVKRVLKNANTGIDILDDSDGIINTYFLTDMSVDDMCECLQMKLKNIHEFITWLLRRVVDSARNDEWSSLLDLITVSSMMDLFAVRRGTYSSYDDYSAYIAGRIRDLL